jgi:hypothetical protein
LTELCWIVSEQWPINLELSGRPFNAEGILAGAALMRMILRPLIKEQADNQSEPDPPLEPPV